MFPIRNVEGLQNLNEAASLQNQVKVVRLQDKLGKQNFHEDMEEVFEPLTNTRKKTSANLPKTSIKNNKTISDLNEKNLDLMNDKGMIALHLASSLVNLFKQEKKVNSD